MAGWLCARPGCRAAPKAGDLGAAAIADERAHGAARIGLAEETGAGRHVAAGRLGSARRDDELHAGVQSRDQMRQREPVDGARHIDVGEQGRDLGVLAEHPKRLLRIGGVEDDVSRILEVKHGAEANEGFIFDDENRLCDI